MPINLDFHLHEKQGIALQSAATELLYGGAAGGGKSHLIRIAAILWALQIPGIQIYLFRRKYNDLIANHIDGPTGFPILLADLISDKKAAYNKSTLSIPFFNNSQIKLCHCQHEKDMYNHQGAEMHVLMFDELTHFTESIYRFLRGRVRLGSLKLPEEFRGLFPRIVAGSNPGNIGHQWVKRSFIEMVSPMEIRRMPKEEGGLLRQYIPALLEDNPSLNENDPDYEMRLEGLGSPELVKAMRYGIWDIVAGAAFEKIDRTKHMLRPFKPVEHWTKFMVIDWGTAKPFSVGWYCINDQDFILAARDDYPERLIPANSLIRYREWYGWNGKPDEGCRMESFQVARRILEIEDEANETMDYRVGDSAMWAEHDGPSIAERMADGTDGNFNMEQSRKDRAANYQEIRARIVGIDETPSLYVTANCLHFWRTVPELQLDMLRPELGYDTSQEDHAADELGYACASRPITTTKREREEHAYNEARRKAHSNQKKRFF